MSKIIVEIESNIGHQYHSLNEEEIKIALILYFRNPLFEVKVTKIEQIPKK